ncbi:hypothetical protein C5613_14815 [Rhodococcus opacus]|uniref:Uncharacterized protein n=1 Tax=Rhodococcus opacus TaxID=37919 RepID=A0A2S8JB27_RHOOP|nr:hypothetical protein C5613_14815 [Rhodococcus opacus]
MILNATESSAQRTVVDYPGGAEQLSSNAAGTLHILDETLSVVAAHPKGTWWSAVVAPTAEEFDEVNKAATFLARHYSGAVGPQEPLPDRDEHLRAIETYNKSDHWLIVNSTP